MAHQCCPVTKVRGVGPAWMKGALHAGCPLCTQSTITPDTVTLGRDAMQPCIRHNDRLRDEGRGARHSDTFRWPEHLYRGSDTAVPCNYPWVVMLLDALPTLARISESMTVLSVVATTVMVQFPQASLTALFVSRCTSPMKHAMRSASTMCRSGSLSR